MSSLLCNCCLQDNEPGEESGEEMVVVESGTPSVGDITVACYHKLKRLSTVSCNLYQL